MDKWSNMQKKCISPSRSSQGVAHEVKKLTWFQRDVLRMNVGICHKQYESYVSNKHMNDNQHALLKEVRAMKPGYESPPLYTMS
jgi:hypothetical protein